MREEVVRAGQPPSIVSVQARFDGKEYAVHGSPIVETIAYTRADERKILGIGRKKGSVSLRETIVLSDDHRTVTQTFSVFSGEREIVNGVAFFEKSWGRRGCVGWHNQPSALANERKHRCCI